MFSFCLLLSCKSSTNDKTPVDYVNPYIGNISHLLVPTFPTVHLPNGMLRVYPERGDYTIDQIKGLPIVITHHREASAFNLTPFVGSKDKIEPTKKYTYDLEKIAPYRYSVYLDEISTEVDYAPSWQSAVYAFSFPEEGENTLVVNTRNGVLEVSDNVVSGFQIISNRGSIELKVYLYLEVEQKPIAVGFVDNGSLNPTINEAEGVDKAVGLRFQKKQVNLRYGISFISVEQAKKNLKREINTYSVDKVAKRGRDIWNEELGKIQVDSDNEDDKEVFYTSLYRTYERMINITEDGKYYSGIDNQIHSDSIPFYTDDWIWDTYRGTHPLRVLIDAEKEKAMIQSFIRMAQQSEEGWMPTFPEITGDSHRMNGNHGVAVVWDAYNKGIRGFDLEAAYNACKGALTEKSLIPWTRTPNTELDVFYNEKGYFPALNPEEQEYIKEVVPGEKRQAVAVTLGTCYDDWCLSQIAKELGKEDDYKYFLNRSYNYRNLYNSTTAFFHPKNKGGKFIEPFDYRFSGGMGARDYYDENNGWVYRWDVPHNVADLIELMGSAENFVNNLDQTFREPLGRSKYQFYAQLPDHTGNVGQFSMSNEPSMHIPYFYNYAGQPWKTQKRVRSLLKQWFRSDLMGVPGDEDGGGLTAFVVFSSMGFYPVTPGSPTYNIGSPLFKNVKIRLSNGKTFEIDTENYSEDNIYIQSATLNGQPWDKPWFGHTDIAEGGVLKLNMGPKANKKWGASLSIAPPSAEAYR